MKRGSEKLASVLKSGSKGEKANLAAHIRLFEGVVIKVNNFHIKNVDKLKAN